VPRWLAAAAFGATIVLAGSAAAQPSDLKSAFVQALGTFSLSLDGTYGDEGPRILASLDALDRSVRQWDDAIGGYQAEARRNPPSDPARAVLMHVDLGGLYLDRGRFADAEREFEAAVAQNAGRPDTFALQGLTHTALGDTEAAAAAFRKALDLDPANAARAYLLARALARAGRPDEARAALRVVIDSRRNEGGDRAPTRFMQFGLVEERPGVEPFFPPAIYAGAFAQLERGDLGAAIVQLRTAAASDVVVSSAVSQSYSVRKAADAFRDGDTGAAIVQLKAAVELYPEASEPHRLLGLVYAAAGDPERAADELKIAIGLNGSDERSRLALADVLTLADDLPAAEGALRDTIAAIPGSGRAHYVLARLYERDGRQAEALGEFERAITFHPLLGLNGIYQTMGELQAVQQHFDAAIEMYSRRIDLQPNDPRAHQDLGDTYARLGRDNEALAEFAVVLLLDAGSAPAYTAIAQVRLRDGAYGQAVEAARRAVAIDPKHAQARYALATALIRLGNTAEGQKELETFQHLQEDEAAARARQLELATLQREASVSSKIGDYAAAVESLRKTLALDPGAVPHLNLGLALLDAKRPGEAIEQFKSAIALGGPIEAHLHLADAYAAAGQDEDSRREALAFQRLQEERLRRAGAGR